MDMPVGPVALSSTIWFRSLEDGCQCFASARIWLALTSVMLEGESGREQLLATHLSSPR